MIDKCLESVSKKFLLVLFLFFVLVNFTIGLFVYKFSQAKEVVDQISFFSSVASLVLAVIAIVYAFSQTISSSFQNGKIQDNLHAIDKQLSKFEHIGNEITSFREVFTTSVNQMNSMTKTMAENYAKMNKEIADELSKINDKVQGSGGNISIEGDINEMIKKVEKSEESSKLMAAYIDGFMGSIQTMVKERNVFKVIFKHHQEFEDIDRECRDVFDAKLLSLSYSTDYVCSVATMKFNRAFDSKEACKEYLELKNSKYEILLVELP